MHLEDCINYIGYKNRGYGRFQIDGFKWLAHRWYWTQKNGPIPDGICVLHRCDNPACINVEHLFLGTRRDNVLDAAQKRKYNKQLTDHQVLFIRNSDSSWRLRELASIFGVSMAMISMIKNNKVWKNVE